MRARRPRDGRSTDAREEGRWLILTVPVPPGGEELLLVDALHRLGARAVERQGARFEARLPPPRSVRALLEEARLAIRASTSMSDPALEWRWHEHDEWARTWRREHEPRRVTGRIVVAAAAADVGADAGAQAGTAIGGDAPRDGDILILLHPSTAFGTAEHPTTRACLSFLERSVRPGHRVLDVGTGSGILAIAAARLDAARVLAVDTDPHAVAAARDNVALNGVAGRVDVRHLAVGPGNVRRLGRNDVVLANLAVDIIGPLLPALRGAAAPGGRLVVSGIMGPERDGLVAAAEAAGWRLGEGADETEEAGWWTGRFAAG